MSSTSSTRSCIEVILGTMTMGWEQASSTVDDAVAKQFIEVFHAAGGRSCDTARIYSGGACEPMLGRALAAAAVSPALAIATKAHPSQPGGLGAVGLRAQLDASLDALGVDSVDLFYLHQPDAANALAETLATMAALLSEGKARAYGLSNFSVLETKRVFALCAENAWPTPSTFQGLLNPLNRLVEAELLPLLRAHGVRFFGYNPLCAGLLSGKHYQAQAAVPKGRFLDNPNYLPRYYSEGYLGAMELLRSACDAEGVTMIDAAFRWLIHHSPLISGDGILLGASSLAHLEQNLAACAAATPLPDTIVAALDEGWASVRDGAFPFWRGYSQDMPGREGLDMGASYTAHGPAK